MDEIRTEKRSVRGAFFSLVILAILYPLSIAPVQWLMYYDWVPPGGYLWRYQIAYTPLARAAELAPDSIGKLLDSYASVLLPKDAFPYPYRTPGGVI
jgi:hypothetical protein